MANGQGGKRVGLGSQIQALKNIGVEHEAVAISNRQKNINNNKHLFANA